MGTLGVLLAMGFPYCMRVVAPITLLNFLNVASQNSILMKDGRSFELLSQVDTVVFDKTGTLTEEQPTVGKLYVLHDELNNLFDNRLDETPEDTLLMYAAAAEHKQSHPIAKAIRQEANARGLACPEIEEAKYEIGYGVRVNVAQKSIWVGSIRFMELEGFTIPAQIETIQRDCYEQGYSLVCVAIDDRVVGGIELQPTIRPEAARLVRYLKKQNISLYILSGDHEKPTRKLAHSLGIEHYAAPLPSLPKPCPKILRFVSPWGKAEVIKTLQAEGKFVCFPPRGREAQYW